MLTWYQSKVKHEESVDGKIKTIAELFLHEAVNFGEVEQHCYEHLKRRIKGPDVDAIAKATFDYVVFYSGTPEGVLIGHPFYRVDINWLDDKTSYLIPALNAEQALERALEQHGTADASHVTTLKKTDILGVWHPHNELWQGDWHNRMELLLELGRHSYDINQSELFNTDGSAKADTGLNIDVVEHDDHAATVTVKSRKGKNISFFKKNGETVDA